MSYPASIQTDYQWLVIVGAFAAFFFGWGTGSNDVANAFGTSVGSGALTVKQAILIAAIFEFTGAMVLGRVSTNVIAGGIADVKVFHNPKASSQYGPASSDSNGALSYGYGMMWTLILGGAWQGFASYVGLNVSATHSIIAGIIGFSLAYHSNAVLWITDAPTSWPPYQGIVPIVVAWIFAPLVTGFSSCVLFSTIRFFVLQSEHSFTRAFYVLPFLVFFTLWINIYFVFTKGAKKSFSPDDNWTDDKAAWVAACVAAGVALIATVSIPWVKKWVFKWAEHDEAKKEARDAHRAKMLEAEANPEGGEVDDGLNAKGLEIPPDIMKDPIGNIRLQCKNICNWDYGMDFFDDLNGKVEDIHERGVKYDPMTEKVFGFLQIFSATCVMFAHGAGEVGYMAGPLATIWYVYLTGKLDSKVVAPIWIIIISAFSLVSGLATYGRNVIKAVGKDLAMITPSRGFSAEICTAMVIMVAAQYGLPTSSSQCITGGIVGVGVAEGVSGVNWKFFLETVSSWIATMFVMGLGTALMFAQGHNAP